MQVALEQAGQNKAKHQLLALLVIVALLLLGGCRQEELLRNLEQREAVEILALLSRAGVEGALIPAADEKDGFQVKVAEADFKKALELLYTYGLPRKQSESFEELTRQHNFVPETPQIAQLRLDRALGLELERLLSALNGVLEARVLLRQVLTEQVLGRITYPVQVSAVIRYEGSKKVLPRLSDEVKRLILANVPGLTPAQIELVMAPIEDLEVGGGQNKNGELLRVLSPFDFSVLEKDYQRARLEIGLMVLLVSICCVIAGLSLGILVGAPRLSLFFWRKHRSDEPGQSSAGLMQKGE